eukprot:7633615-Pyramimonas_sp.AAC.1
MLSKVNTWLLTSRRKLLDPNRVEDEAMLATEQFAKYDIERLYRDAGVVFHKCFGLARVRGKSKFTSFGKRSRREAVSGV